jgi:Holliday junction resolvasome RuvABC DNA-binding subunit
MPLATEVASKAFAALRTLGFRESEARRAIADATHAGAPPDVEALVRRCLHVLTEQVAKAS